VSNGQPGGDRIEPLFPIKDLAESYGRSVRALKDQIRAAGMARIVIGSQWYFTKAQLEAFHKAKTVTSGERAQPDPLEVARGRVAQRVQAVRRRGLTGSGMR